MLIFLALGLHQFATKLGIMYSIEMKGVCFYFKLLSFCVMGFLLFNVIRTQTYTMRILTAAVAVTMRSTIYVHFQSASILDFCIEKPELAKCSKRDQHTTNWCVTVMRSYAEAKVNAYFAIVLE